MVKCISFFFFFFNDTASPEIYTLSLHDALPIFMPEMGGRELAQRLTALQPGLKVLYLSRSEEHTSELQSHSDLVCRLLLEKKKTKHPRKIVRTTTSFATDRLVHKSSDSSSTHEV